MRAKLREREMMLLYAGPTDPGEMLLLLRSALLFASLLTLFVWVLTAFGRFYLARGSLFAAVHVGFKRV